MSKFNSYKITMTVDNLIMYPQLTPLDASLASIVSQLNKENVDYSKPIDMSDIFEYHDGVPMASYPVFTLYHSHYHTPTRNVTRHLSDDMILNLKDKVRRNKYSTFNKSAHLSYSSGKTYNVLIPQDSKVEYYFTGDAVKVKKLLEMVPSIGARTTNGFGAIRKIVITKLREGEHIGILSPDGELIRPVPHGDIGINYSGDNTITRGRYSAPYAQWLIDAMNLEIEKIVVPVWSYPVMFPFNHQPEAGETEASV